MTATLSILLARCGSCPIARRPVDQWRAQDEYSPINSQYAIGIHGYVLVYSIASRNSFNMIQTVYDKIVDFCGVSKIPCVIVGSKSDLSMS